MNKDGFRDHVLGLLLPFGPVEAKALFGGYGLYWEDTIFAIIAWERLWFRVDGETRGRFAEAGSEPFTYEGKRKPVEMPYWAAPPGSLESPDALLPWAELGLAAAQRVAAAKKGKSKGRRNRS